jgi:hypothetical protein
VTFDLFFRGMMIAFAAVHAFVAVRALRAGRWPEAGRIYERAEAPRAYWREIALACLRILLAVTALLVVPARAAGAPEPPYAPAVILVVFAPALIRILWAGEIVWGSNIWGRREDPVAYWVIVLFGLALVALFAFAFVSGIAGA